MSILGHQTDLTWTVECRIRLVSAGWAQASECQSELPGVSEDLAVEVVAQAAAAEVGGTPGSKFQSLLDPPRPEPAVAGDQVRDTKWICILLLHVAFNTF